MIKFTKGQIIQDESLIKLLDNPKYYPYAYYRNLDILDVLPNDYLIAMCDFSIEFINDYQFTIQRLG